MRGLYHKRSFAFAWALCLLGVGMLVHASGSLFSTSQRVTQYPKPAMAWPHTFSSGQHSVAVMGKTVYLAWYDTSRGDYDAYLTKSSDEGQSFGPAVRINDDEGTAVQFKPTLALGPKGEIYAAWRDSRKGDADIFFARSTDGGRTFSKNFSVIDDPKPNYQGNPSMATDRKGNIYLAFGDLRDEDANIYMAVSTNGGRSFTKNRRVDDDAHRTRQNHPAVAADEIGTIYIAYEDFRNGLPDVYLTRSLDGGKTFEASRKLNDDTNDVIQSSPTIAAGNKGLVVVAWIDFRNDTTLIENLDTDVEENRWVATRKGNPDIYYTVSLDGGKTFSPNRKLNDDPEATVQAYPSVAIDFRGYISMVWEDGRDGGMNIYFARSTDQGQRFSQNIPVNDGPRNVDHFHPSLAVNGVGRPYVIWTDERNNPFASHGGEEGNDVYFALEE